MPSIRCAQSNALLRLEHCMGCECLIMDSKLIKVFPDRFLHEHCAVCSVCNSSLMPCHSSIKCYEKASRLFCRVHYFEYFVPKTICVGCNLSIQLDELFCNLKNGIAYHFRCLRCIQCGKNLERGDRFVMRENCGTVKCLEHSEVERNNNQWPKGGKKAFGKRGDGGARDKRAKMERQIGKEQSEVIGVSQAEGSDKTEAQNEMHTRDQQKKQMMPSLSSNSLKSDKEEGIRVRSISSSSSDQRLQANPSPSITSHRSSTSPSQRNAPANYPLGDNAEENGTKRREEEDATWTAEGNDEEGEASSMTTTDNEETLSEGEECWKRRGRREEEDGEGRGKRREEEKEIGREGKEGGRGREGKGNGRGRKGKGDGRGRKGKGDGRGRGDGREGVRGALTTCSAKGRCANTPGPLLEYPSEMYAVGEQFSREEEDAHQKAYGNKRRGPRTTISQKQLDILNRVFDCTSKPSKHERAKLAQDSGLSMRVIQHGERVECSHCFQVWFQNRRSKERRLKHLCNFLRHYEDQPRIKDAEKRARTNIESADQQQTDLYA